MKTTLTPKRATGTTPRQHTSRKKSEDFDGLLKNDSTSVSDVLAELLLDINDDLLGLEKQTENSSIGWQMCTATGDIDIRKTNETMV